MNFWRKNHRKTGNKLITEFYLVFLNTKSLISIKMKSIVRMGLYGRFPLDKDVHMCSLLLNCCENGTKTHITCFFSILRLRKITHWAMGHVMHSLGNSLNQKFLVFSLANFLVGALVILLKSHKITLLNF